MSTTNPRVLLIRAGRTVSRRPTRWWQKARGKQFVHFLHLGKTGGTAIKYALRNSKSPDRFAIYLHPHKTRLSDVPVGESVVFFLRDPISRFTSGFFSRQRQGQPRYTSRWSPEEEGAFSTFSSPNQLALALSSANDEERAGAVTAMRSIEHVRDSYWRWFVSREYFLSRRADLFFVGFQASLAADFEILKAKLSLPDSLRLPDNDIDAHRNPADVDRTLDHEATANLRRWYKGDFQFIDLCREILRDDESIRSPDSSRGRRRPPSRAPSARLRSARPGARSHGRPPRA
jgi:hypothetical protein